ncbi:hypothetical protein [Pseudanabaena yagii]|uniref:Uncharacterized protein n=1 Tax=Pseudanabaena yagii GIHE-NHR1 TaxID=2722753 RepID=A0ABX1LKX2_9CYAN|nr:hypothetical protein [Pseudanabaena yagii]NMF56747.1 hypothetical protein [Pseudanabaena yagii GIHE-NHR1]
MAYSDFTLARVKEDLGLLIKEGESLFAEVEPVTPSDYLRETLKRAESFVTLVNTEKVRSEFLIAPVLGEVRAQLQPSVSLFSGTEFNVDVSLGLQGFCDFILSKSSEQIDITAPVIAIAEAKNESIRSGLGQCIAEMFAAQIFNQRHGQPCDRIYGAVTTGSLWRFLILKDNIVYIDQPEYFIGNVDKILGILMLPFA